MKIFLKWLKKKHFVIIAVFVNDLSIIGPPEELPKTINYLKKEFEMKDLGKTKFCLGLQIEHLKNATDSIFSTLSGIEISFIELQL